MNSESMCYDNIEYKHHKKNWVTETWSRKLGPQNKDMTQIK